MAIDFSQIRLTRDCISVPQPIYTSTAGAIVDFIGVVRGKEDVSAIQGLDYETFAEMAAIKLRQIAEETANRFPIEDLSLIHRVGFVAVGEPSLFLRVTSGHRDEAFLASREIIERLKQEVPIWKNPVIA